MARVVDPEPVTLTLASGETLTVRKRLNYGETQRSLKWMALPELDATGKLRADAEKAGVYQVIAYLIDWTVTDNDGAILPVRECSKDDVFATLNHLDEDDVEEIRAVVQAHIATQDAARAQEKKARAGVTGSAPTLQSVA